MIHQITLRFRLFHQAKYFDARRRSSILELKVVLESIGPEFGRQARADEERLDAVLDSEVMTFNSILWRGISSCGIDLIAIKLEELSN